MKKTVCFLLSLLMIGAVNVPLQGATQESSEYKAATDVEIEKLKALEARYELARAFVEEKVLDGRLCQIGTFEDKVAAEDCRKIRAEADNVCRLLYKEYFKGKGVLSSVTLSSPVCGKTTIVFHSTLSKDKRDEFLSELHDLKGTFDSKVELASSVIRLKLDLFKKIEAEMIPYLKGLGIELPPEVVDEKTHTDELPAPPSINSYMPDFIKNHPLLVGLGTATGLCGAALLPLVYKYYQEKPDNMTLYESVCKEVKKSFWLKCALVGAVGVGFGSVVYKCWPQVQ